MVTQAIPFATKTFNDHFIDRMQSMEAIIKYNVSSRVISYIWMMHSNYVTEFT